jgi:hypothetical protein
MADNTNKNDTSDVQVPGIPFREFEGATQVLKALRDQGTYTILLNRTGMIRLVGNVQDFQRLFSEKISRDTDTRETMKVLAEVRQFSRVVAFFDSVDGALKYLEHTTYDDEFKKLHGKEEKASFRKMLQEKLRLVLDLLPPAFRERQKRLRTATDASLEDVDVEVIQERRDDYQAVTVDQPFLRLRVRYSDGFGPESLPWFFGPAPWGNELGFPCKTFSLECDETDIDVLLFRLREAKRLLSSAVVGSTSGESDTTNRR